MTTSHSRSMPRATASTGSNERARSSQATTEPWAWASAATRSARVVRPLEPSPRMATLADRGRPPGPEDRIERREPGVDDPVVVRAWGGDRGRRGRFERASASASAPWVAP